MSFLTQLLKSQTRSAEIRLVHMSTWEMEMLRKPELRGTWQTCLIHCPYRLDKANFCAKQDLICGTKMKKEHYPKIQQSSCYLSTRLKQSETLNFYLYMLFPPLHIKQQNGLVTLHAFAEGSNDSFFKISSENSNVSSTFILLPNGKENKQNLWNLEKKVV